MANAANAVPDTMNEQCLFAQSSAETSGPGTDPDEDGIAAEADQPAPGGRASRREVGRRRSLGLGDGGGVVVGVAKRPAVADRLRGDPDDETDPREHALTTATATPRPPAAHTTTDRLCQVSQGGCGGGLSCSASRDQSRALPADAVLDPHKT